MECCYQFIRKCHKRQNIQNIMTQGSTGDYFIIYYEKFKTQIKYFDVNVCEVIFCLNILCEADLSDEDLRI